MITKSKKYPGKFTLAANFRPKTLSQEQMIRMACRMLNMAAPATVFALRAAMAVACDTPREQYELRPDQESACRTFDQELEDAGRKVAWSEMATWF